MNDDNTDLTNDSSPPSSLTLPIIEPNETLLSSMSTSVPAPSVESDDKLIIAADDHDENTTENSSHPSSVEDNDKHSPSSPAASPRTIISALLDSVIAQIESTSDNQLHSLPVIEDDQMEIEDDDDDDDEDENDDDDEDRESVDKSVSSRSSKTDKERTLAKTSSPSKTDLKPTTRTLRSHARGRRNLVTLTQTSAAGNSHVRRVSSRRRALESKMLLAGMNKERKRRTTSERSTKDKDSTITNEDMQTSSNSDDQASENANEKSSMAVAGNANDEGSSCSSTGAGDESSTSSSTTNTKQPTTSAEIDSLPPNKRRLRERNAATATTSIPSITTDAAANSNSASATDASPVESTAAREIPTNSIKQFLEIRQQIDKRHETMLNEFVLPKVPKDFPETTMAKKSYLIAPSLSSYSNTTPLSMGIKRLLAPHDLDGHLADVFGKQEDERYKMKLRHQVERDKLVLSHEQEILRLYGNATRSSANQDIPFSYCSLMKDSEVYNNPSIQLPEKLLNNDYTNAELGKRGKNRWNGRLFIKWLEDSNLKYKRLSCELNSRQSLEAETLYSMQRMVWLKHLPKESTGITSSASGRLGYLLSERYLPRVEINTNFWTNWETSPF